ncbi:hypothetical protein [Bacillus sp. AK031]
MSNTGDEFKLDEWEKWLKDWLLDPYTTKLDEMEFRVDLFDTTDAFIVEATTSDFTVQEVVLIKQSHTLTIEILPLHEKRKRSRSVDFPFSLEKYPVRLHPLKGCLEIHILKICENKPAPSVIRYQGHL